MSFYCEQMLYADPSWPPTDAFPRPSESGVSADMLAAGGYDKHTLKKESWDQHAA